MENQITQRFCHNCGASIQPASAFCPYCGIQAIRPSHEAAAQPQMEQAKPSANIQAASAPTQPHGSASDFSDEYAGFPKKQPEPYASITQEPPAPPPQPSAPPPPSYQYERFEPAEQPQAPYQQPPQPSPPYSEQNVPYNGYQQPVCPQQPMGPGQNVAPEEPGLIASYVKFWKNYANFSGRSRRADYWYVVLADILIFFSPSVMMGILIGLRTSSGYYYGEEMEFITIPLSLLCSLYFLAGLIPNLAVLVRRLHDTGKSGIYLLIILFPIVGSLLLFIFLVQDSQPGPNQYGYNPKGIGNNQNFAEKRR